MFSSGFQLVFLASEFHRGSLLWARLESGFWVEGSSPIPRCDRIEFSRVGLSSCMCQYTCFCSTQSKCWYLINDGLVKVYADLHHPHIFPWELDKAFKGPYGCSFCTRVVLLSFWLMRPELSFWMIWIVWNSICDRNLQFLHSPYQWWISCWKRTVSLVLQIEFCWSQVLVILYYLVSDMFFSWLWWLSFLEKWS